MNNIWRTSFRHTTYKSVIPPSTELCGVLGFIPPKYPDRNKTCVYCKNTETVEEREISTLKPFNDYYENKVESFKVYNCTCGAKFSVYKMKGC